MYQIGFNRVQARKLEQIGRVACGQDTTATVTFFFLPLLLTNYLLNMEKAFDSTLKGVGFLVAFERTFFGLVKARHVTRQVSPLS